MRNLHSRSLNVAIREGRGDSAKAKTAIVVLSAVLYGLAARWLTFCHDWCAFTVICLMPGFVRLGVHSLLALALIAAVTICSLRVPSGILSDAALVSALIAEGLIPEAPLPRLAFGVAGALPPGMRLAPGGWRRKKRKDDNRDERDKPDDGAGKKPKKKARAA